MRRSSVIPAAGGEREQRVAAAIQEGRLGLIGAEHDRSAQRDGAQQRDRYEFAFGHHTIEVLDPLREWRLRWDPVEQGVVLVTTFLLEEENGGTWATITETGYESLPEDQRQQWVDSITSGYTMSMENLKAHVEGRPIPH